jgi:hypothetical protein
MNDKKYLILEQHKFSSFNDTWNVKFANLNENKAFEKLVALRTINEDTDKIYYIVNMEYLWTKDKLIDNEVKDNQDEMPF